MRVWGLKFLFFIFCMAIFQSGWALSPQTLTPQEVAFNRSQLVVMILDDDPTNCRTFSRYLKTKIPGTVIHTAKNIQEATAIMMGHPEINALWSDYSLTGEVGPTFIDWVVTSGHLNHLGTVFIYSSDPEENIQETIGTYESLKELQVPIIKKSGNDCGEAVEFLRNFWDRVQKGELGPPGLKTTVSA